jgi:regulator of nucleoside diphosphate kinase
LSGTAETKRPDERVAPEAKVSPAEDSQEEAMIRSSFLPPDPRRPEIEVTKQDLGNLESMLSSHSTQWTWRTVEYLVRELMRATVVDEGSISSKTVTMGSRVKYREAGQATSYVVTLSYPSERELFRDAISVLTPIGAALIGLSEGQSICYIGPDGRPVTIEVIEVLYQPETDSHMRFKPRPRRNSART